jgi:peptidoglycan/LPS O-acetylase OafA/YrhL
VTPMTELVAEPVRDLVAAKPKGYLPVLDGLRAVSILFVLLGHVLLRERPTPAIRDLGQYSGSHGVSVFFVISGYLITLLLLREERRDGSISLKNFYIRRVLRIFPAFYAYLLVFACLAATGFILGVPWHDYVASAFYIRNISGRAHETSHLWSLSLEEQFYLIWPTVVVIVAARRRLGMLAVAMLAITAWRTYLVVTGRTNWVKLYIRPDQRMDTILVGCALALMTGGERFERLSAAVLERTWFVTAVVAGLAAWFVLAWRIPYVGSVEHTVTAILIALIVHWLLRNPTAPAARLLQVSALLYIGRLSYSLYIWQGLFMSDRTPELDAIRRVPLDLVLTFVCALASYYLIERPFLVLKDRYFR